MNSEEKPQRKRNARGISKHLMHLRFRDDQAEFIRAYAVRNNCTLNAAVSDIVDKGMKREFNPMLAITTDANGQVR